MLLLEDSRDLETRYTGKLDIREDDVRFVDVGQADGFKAGRRLGDDSEARAVFDEASLAILQEWRKLVEEQIIPEGVFTMGEADYIDAFAKGTYAFSPQQIYDLKVFNDPNRSQIAGQVAPVPVVDQPWGMIDEGIYAVANRNQSEERLARDYRLAGFFGYRDQIEGGELYVAKRWAIEAALNPAEGEWLYFVATDPENGVTEFAETYEEFEQLKLEFEQNRGDL